jgi:hypothetical protein
MKKKHRFKCKIAASLVSLALLTFASSAIATVTVTVDNQNGPASFTPTWTPASDSLIAGLTPSLNQGSFAHETCSGDLAPLTTIHSLTVPSGYSAACGDQQGNLLVYTLPASANGYNITNITTYSGWGDGGRDGQGYTVYYSTAAAPGIWLPLAGASIRNDGPSLSQPSCNRVTINDSVNGTATIAANVDALLFDFGNPGVENGWVGMGAITVEGSVASGTASPLPISITGSVQSGSNPFTPTWTAETPDLLLGLSPSSAIGTFNNESTVGTGVLTDGTIGNSGNNSTMASCGSGGGNSLVYTLTNSLNGSDVTNIVVYSGWADTGRYGQYYIISYSTVSAPSIFIPLTTVYYLPPTNGTPACRVTVNTPTAAALAKNVGKIKFDFSSPPEANRFNNGWQGYSEIIVQGTNSSVPPVGPSPILVQDTTPNSAETSFTGEQIVFTAAYSNTPPASVQWQKITSGPTTNNINVGVVTVTNNGVVISTLTLNNVQISDSATYMLKATNSADGTAAPSYSTGAQLVAASTPAAVNNIIINYAGQTFPGSTANFFPQWAVDTNDLNLILRFQYGSGPGTLTYPTPNGLGFAQGGCNADPSIMSDGMAASMTSLPTTTFCACGRLDFSAGTSVTYSLVTNSAAYGLEITNITVFGGWVNADHDEQKYQVLYSTVQSPGTFVPLAVADYLPTDSTGSPSVTRTTLVPENGVLAHNVAALQFNWNVSPNPKNGWGAYSEILVGGSPATGLVPALTSDVTPNTASDVVGSQIILTAGFSGAMSLQWQFNGTNVPGAMSSSLTLNNLQLTNSGNYALLGINAAGTNSSHACAVTVSPAPSAISNAVVSIAAQTSLATQFTPTWDSSLLSSSLIYNITPASGNGSFTTPDGNGENANTPVILTDGSWGYLKAGDESTITCIGSDAGAGNFVTYTLTGSTNGYTITNVVSSGGWADSGRDQQAYTLYYSTVANPTNFIPLAVVNYNPPNPIGISTTRATITPEIGALAGNVAALKFDMTSPAGKNGYSGYNELAAYGSISGPLLIAPQISSVTQSGGNLIVVGTGGYPVNSSYTWLATTNLSPPVIWTTNGTGVLDVTGAFSNSIPVGPNQATFFRFRMP